MNQQVYETVLGRIAEGTVTTADFNRLIEATDKSTRERALRHVRPGKATPSGRSTFGRIVPKLTGVNDPPNQGRGRRYASGKPAKVRQNYDQAEHLAAKPGLNADALAIKAEDRVAAIQFIKEHNGRVLIEQVVPGRVLVVVRGLCARLLSDGDFRTVFEGKHGLVVASDWLYDVLRAADAVLPTSATLAEDACPNCDEEWRAFRLAFDKAGYANNLRNELGRRGLIEDRDWRHNNGNFWIRAGVVLDEEMMDWLLDVGRISAIGKADRYAIFR